MNYFGSFGKLFPYSSAKQESVLDIITHKTFIRKKWILFTYPVSSEDYYYWCCFLFCSRGNFYLCRNSLFPTQRILPHSPRLLWNCSHWTLLNSSARRRYVFWLQAFSWVHTIISPSEKLLLQWYSIQQECSLMTLKMNM